MSLRFIRARTAEEREQVFSEITEPAFRIPLAEFPYVFTAYLLPVRI